MCFVDNLVYSSIALITFTQDPTSASNQVPEYFIQKISLPVGNLSNTQFENYLKNIENVRKNIDTSIKSILILQKNEIAKYKSNPSTDHSYQKLSEVIELNALQKDEELLKAEVEFSKNIIELFEKYQIEEREQHSNDFSIASRAAQSFARQGIGDNPGARYVTVAIPQGNLIIVEKFTKDLVPIFENYMTTYNRHIQKLRTTEQSCRKVTTSLGVPILIRAIELQNFNRLKSLLSIILISYSRLLNG